MKYILTSSALIKLYNLREEYQKEKKIDFNEKTSFFGIPTIVGGTDVDARKIQIIFIEQMSNVFHHQIINGGNYFHFITASRFLITVCLFIKSQIWGNSYLEQRIDEILNISPTNPLDDEDLKICYESTRNVLKVPFALKLANDILRKMEDKGLITESMWKDFNIHVENTCQKLKQLPLQENVFFITEVTKSIFEPAFACVGAGIGFVAGDLLSQSNHLLGTRFTLTAGLTSALVTFHAAPAVALSFLAPIIASHVLKSVCQTSLAYIGWESFRYIGKAAGTVVGMPLDLLYLGSKEAYSYYKKRNRVKGMDGELNLSGFRLADGAIMIKGVEELSELASALTHQVIEPPKDSLFYNKSRDNHDIKLLDSGDIYLNNQRLCNLTDISPELVEIFENLKLNKVNHPVITQNNPPIPTLS